MCVFQATGIPVGLKLKIPVDQSVINLPHDFQQLQRNMISHLRKKKESIRKFCLNSFNFVAISFLLCDFTLVFCFVILLYKAVFTLL